MSFDPVTSRRTIVRTSAKVAYAAPLIAASLSLETARAGTVISGAGCDECAALSTDCARGVCDHAQGKCVLQPINEDHCCGVPGSRCTAGVCTPYLCDAGYQDVGGVCVPYAPGQCTRPDGCACGFENVGGVCIPLPSCFV